MKKIITLSVLSIAALGVNAQITIDQASFATWTPSVDTNQLVSQVNITASANGNWDLSTGTYTSQYEIARAPINSTDFPQASYAYDAFYNFSALAYDTEMYEGITSTGRVVFGERMARQAISISAITGGTNDSVVFPQQTIPYSATRNQIVFPATAGSMWSSNYQYTTNFNLTVASYGLNSVPCHRSTHTTMVDTVKGWGKMKVKDLAGNVSAAIDVLAVKRVLTVSDSFYMAGSPAPTPLLTAFGLTQGQKDHRYHIYYYRSGEVEPLYTERYSDSTFTTKSSSATHGSRIPLPATNVNTVSNESTIIMYPNPVTNGDVQIILGEDAHSHKWSYELTNIAGQRVASDSVYPKSGKAHINFNSKMNGVYFITIYKNGKKEAVKRIVLQ